MSGVIECSHCRAQYAWDPQLVGQQLPCAYCGRLIAVPPRPTAVPRTGPSSPSSASAGPSSASPTTASSTRPRPASAGPASTYPTGASSASASPTSYPRQATARPAAAATPAPAAPSADLSDILDDLDALAARPPRRPTWDERQFDEAPRSPYRPTWEQQEIGEAPRRLQAIRRAHITTETFIRFLGTMYYFSVVVTAVVIVVAYFMSPTEGQARMPAAVRTGFIIGFAIGFGIVALAFIALGTGLRELRPWARWIAAALAVFGLFNFPFGTLFSIGVLYLLLSRKGARVFTDEYAEVIRETPNVRCHPIVSILCWTYMALSILGVVLIMMYVSTALKSAPAQFERRSPFNFRRPEAEEDSAFPRPRSVPRPEPVDPSRHAPQPEPFEPQAPPTLEPWANDPLTRPADDIEDGRWSVVVDPPRQTFSYFEGTRSTLTQLPPRCRLVVPATNSPYLALVAPVPQGSQVGVVDLESGQFVHRKLDPSLPVNSLVALSPDGQTVAYIWTIGHAGITVWPLVENGSNSRGPDNKGTIKQLAFANNTQVVAMECSGNQVELMAFGVGGGSDQWRAEITTARPPVAPVWALSPGGASLAVLFDGELRIYDTADGRLRGTAAVPDNFNKQAECCGMAFSRDGALLAAIASENPLELCSWDVASGQLVDVLKLDRQQAGLSEQPVRYRGQWLEWLPSGGHWLLFGKTLVERPSGQVVATLPSPADGFRHVLDDHRAMRLVSSSSGSRAEIDALP